jgi:hypothetical protein
VLHQVLLVELLLLGEENSLLFSPQLRSSQGTSLIEPLSLNIDGYFNWVMGQLLLQPGNNGKKLINPAALLLSN